MRGSTLTILMLVQACASGPTGWTPAARVDPASCAAPSTPAGKPWQLVAEAGFTFCVPSDWRLDGHMWRGGGGSITWGIGTPAPWPMIRGEVVGTITGPVTRINSTGQVTSQGTVPMVADNAQGGAQCSDQRFTERVGGLMANFYHVCFGRHFTGAWWLTRGVYVTGDAADALTAELQMQVYRSVRFGTAPER